MDIEEYIVKLEIYDLNNQDICILISRARTRDLYQMMVKISSDGKFERRTASTNYCEKKYSLAKSFKVE